MNTLNLITPEKAFSAWEKKVKRKQTTKLFIGEEAKAISFSLVAFCKPQHSQKKVEVWIFNINLR